MKMPTYLAGAVPRSGHEGVLLPCGCGGKGPGRVGAEHTQAGGGVEAARPTQTPVDAQALAALQPVGLPSDRAPRDQLPPPAQTRHPHALGAAGGEGEGRGQEQLCQEAGTSGSHGRALGEEEGRGRHPH